MNSTAQPALQPDPEPSLETLMSQYVNGSAAAFDALYRRTAPKLYGYLLRLSRDHALAEDVLQTTFAKVHRARDAYLAGSPFVPWILVIARRTFYDELRSANRRWEVLTDDGTPIETGVADASEDWVLARDLKKALSELPAHYREAIELTKLGGLSGLEAARLLETTKSAVKLRVHRGYQILRGLLDEPGSETWLDEEALADTPAVAEAA